MNKFIARGITKEGKFVYGYYAKIKEKHFIITSEALIIDDYPAIYIHTLKDSFGELGILTSHLVEIIKEPDKCLNFKDKNGKMLYENTQIRLTGKNLETTTGFILYEENSMAYHIYSEKENKDEFFILSLEQIIRHRWVIETIGNTHNIKEEE